MPDNAADRKDIRRREKQARIANAQRQDVIRNLMSTTQGRHWMWDVLSDCHCFSTTFNGDALQSAFNEGGRARGLAILADILIACPDQYIQAQREANVRDTIDERRSSPIDDGRDSGPSERDPADPADSYASDGWDTPNEPGRSEAAH